MRAVPALVHRLLGLLHPEWGLRLGPAGPGRRRRGATGVVLDEETRTGDVVGGAPVEAAMRCCYDGANLTAPVLIGRCELTSLRGATLVKPELRRGARVLASDLAEVRWTGGGGPDAELIACSLRQAHLHQVDLGALQLCDLAGARLEQVHLARALACDLSDAVMVDCDLEGADLRGSRFRRASFQGGSLRGARVEGADFSGARGLDPQIRRRLIEGGARFHGAWTARLLARLWPGSDPLFRHRVGRWVQPAVWVLAVAGGGLGTWTSLRPPPVTATASQPPTRDRIPTEEERTRTRSALRDLRSALSAAHEVMLANGAQNRSWPSMTEFQEGHFDSDGDGPGEQMAPLIAGDRPGNFLTDSEGGVLPYCNEDPTQATLAGVDTDWHYCEQTGRVFAGAGFSGQATLNW